MSYYYPPPKVVNHARPRTESNLWCLSKELIGEIFQYDFLNHLSEHGNEGTEYSYDRKLDPTVYGDTLYLGKATITPALETALIPDPELYCLYVGNRLRQSVLFVGPYYINYTGVLTETPLDSGTIVHLNFQSHVPSFFIRNISKITWQTQVVGDHIPLHGGSPKEEMIRIGNSIRSIMSPDSPALPGQVTYTSILPKIDYISIEFRDDNEHLACEPGNVAQLTYFHRARQYLWRCLYDLLRASESTVPVHEICICCSEHTYLWSYYEELYKMLGGTKQLMIKRSIFKSVTVSSRNRLRLNPALDYNLSWSIDDPFSWHFLPEESKSSSEEDVA